MFHVLRTRVLILLVLHCDWCSGAEGPVKKWSVSSQFNFNTHWQPGQEPITHIKITQNSSPGAPNQFQTLVDSGKVPDINSIINRAIETANQQLQTQVQQLNLQGQFPPAQMHTFNIQTPQTGDRVQTFRIPWQQANQMTQSSLQSPQQQSPPTFQVPSNMQPVPQSQPPIPMQRPMFQGQRPTNQMQASNFQQQRPTNQMPTSNFQQQRPPYQMPASNFQQQRPTNQMQASNFQQQRPTNQMPPSYQQQRPTNQMPAFNSQQQRPTNEMPTSNFQTESNSQTRVGGNFVQEEDDRPTWGAPSANRVQQPQQQRPVPNTLRPVTTTLPPPVIMKSNTSSLTFIIRDREFEPSVPPAADYVKNSVSLRYCLSYCNIRFIQNGGEIAVVGGENARLNEFPHMVTLGFSAVNFEGKTVVSWNSCGGSLISRNFVMTAAHCMFSTKGRPTQVRVGEHDLSTTEDGAQPQDLPIDDIIIHPNYNPEVSEYNDIALIKLVGHVTFTKYMRPACLHTGLPSIEYTDRPWKPIATGWGNLGFADFPSDILQKVNLDIIDNTTCKRLLKPNDYIPSGVNDDTQICAGVLAGGRDTCLGDSGGPLQVNNTVFHWLRECPMDIVGITSIGIQCAKENTPSIYTRVKHFVPWIESIVWPGET